MEHRCGERLVTTLKARIHRNGGAAVDCTLRNLSAGGAFVALAADRAVLRGVVDLELTLPGDQRACRWRAYVIHQGLDGVGLMFDEQDMGRRLQFLTSQRARGIQARAATESMDMAMERAAL
jgi:hypothetical protein